jgi:hypothetical protein
MSISSDGRCWKNPLPKWSENMISRKTLAAVAVAVAGLVASPGVADAAISSLKSYEGSDYSVNGSDGVRIWVCDNENDSHDVSADWVRAGSSSEYHVIDTYGNSCTMTTSSARIYAHRAVELVPVWTDYYGSWVYPR